MKKYLALSKSCKKIVVSSGYRQRDVKGSQTLSFFSPFPEENKSDADF